MMSKPQLYRHTTTFCKQMPTLYYLLLVFSLLCIIIGQLGSINPVLAEEEGEEAGSEFLVESVYKPTTGCETVSEIENKISVQYTGWLSSGKQFATSGSNEPVTFKLGGGQVIQGWDRGLVHMCVGETRKLTIPPELGYGDEGSEPMIPGKATLIYEVELVEIHPREALKFDFKDHDRDGDGLLSLEEVKRYLWYMASQLSEMAEAMATKETRQKKLNAVMASHDRNKDGFLTEDEFNNQIPRDEL